jgi:hypothetical protein
MKKTLLTTFSFASIFSFGQIDSMELSLSQDAFVHSAPSYDQTNYGKDQQLPANNWTFSGNHGAIMSYLQFDLTKLPSNAKIKKVVLKLSAWNSQEGFGPHSALTQPNDFSFYRVTAPWSEETLNWVNKPLYSSQNAKSEVGTSEGDKDYKTIDITTLVNDIIQTNNYGLLLKLNTDEHYSKMNFCSSNHIDTTKQPKVLVYFEKATFNTIELTPFEDAFVHSAPGYDETNYGKDQQLPANNWTFSGQTGIIYSMIKFDLSSIIPEKEIEKVTLSLKAWNSQEGFGPHSPLTKSNDFSFYRILSPWVETVVTWKNKPDYSTTNSVNVIGTDIPSKDYEIDLTSLTKDLISTKNYGFLMKLNTEDFYSKVNFCSKDHTTESKRPVLKITYSDKVASITKPENENTISVYPNPANNLLFIRNTITNSAVVEIVNLQGQRIYENYNVSNNEAIDISNFSTGVYFVSVNGLTVNKIVKE